MPALTWYATNNLASVHQAMSETSPGANATASPVTGWIVGTTAPTVYSKFDSQVERTASTFAATPIEPDGSIDTTIGDCLRTEGTYSGTFDTGNWTCTFSAIAVNNGGSQDGRAGFRVFTSPNADGTSATEVTAARQAGGLMTNLATSAQQDSAATFSINTFTVTNEYIFVQLGWEITGAGGMTSADVDMRIGDTATRVVSANFTQTAINPFKMAATGVG